MAAKELGLTTTTEGGSNLTMNLTLMQDGYPGLEHAMPIFPLFKDVVQLQAASGITYTPTLIVGYGGPIGPHLLAHALQRRRGQEAPTTSRRTMSSTRGSRRTYNREDQYIFKGHAEQLAKMVNAGGRVGLGSHGELQGLGVHWELWMMAVGRHEDARRAARGDASMAPTPSDSRRTSARSRSASSPTCRCSTGIRSTDIQNTNTMRYVMKNGRLYEGDTLNEVWPRAKPLPPQWWWREDPPAPKAPRAN